MKRVLLVDDDAVILRVYQDGLASRGFHVETASDGLTATKAVRTARPDIVILDLMMPKLSGVDVLKFIRAESDLRHLPVIVFSNAYMDTISREAEAVGIQKAMLKVRSSPASLAEAIESVLAATVGEANPASSPSPASPVPATDPVSPPGSESPPAAATERPQPAESKQSEEENRARARRDLVASAAANSAALGTLFQAFSAAQSAVERDLRLSDFYRKVHFVTALAGLAGHQKLASFATVFEGMLFGLMDNPSLISPSCRQTMMKTIELFETLFQLPADSAPLDQSALVALVVDDDPLSTRVAASALRLVQLTVQTTEDSLTAWRLVNQKHFDLLLLDLEMPLLGGLQFCRNLRRLQGYEKTPVIYVTSHTDFASRAEGVLSGGDDLIAKPVFPMELAVKAVTYLLERHLAG